MNNRIIRAPISKIVEAIKNKLHDYADYHPDGVLEYYTIETITEALASLGGEETYNEIFDDWLKERDELFDENGEAYTGTFFSKRQHEMMYKTIEQARVIAHPSEREIVGVSLKNWIYDKLHECERNHSYELATETVRCWIDEYIKTHPNTTHSSEREVLEFLKKLPLPLPSNHKLVIWANQIRGFYGHPVYLVGSQTTGKENPRDVDVVCGIPDYEFTLRYGDVIEWLEQGATGQWTDVRWNWADDCTKRSIDGTNDTGFLIDFKVQPMAQFNGFTHIPKIRLDTRQ